MYNEDKNVSKESFVGVKPPLQKETTNLVLVPINTN